MKNLRFILLAFVFTTLIVIQGAACVLDYTLTDSAGNTTEVRPGATVTLTTGSTYTLNVRFTPDHGRCKVPTEDTMFLLEDEKWKSSKDYLPLQLLNSASWQKINSRTYAADLRFTALTAGKVSLEVLRECTKGGYDEFLSFQVN